MEQEQTAKQDGYLDINDFSPARPMKVEWICENGVYDVGFFDGEKFTTFDIREDNSPITKWKPFNHTLQ